MNLAQQANNLSGSHSTQQQPNIYVTWLNRPVKSIDQYLTAKNAQKSSSSSYSSYLLANLKDLGLKSSVFARTNSIGVIGDFIKQSYFSVESFQLKNYDTSLDAIEYEFESANPRVFEFDSYEKLSRLGNLEIAGQPQIVDTRYGKSIMFSSPEQRLKFNNVSHECFGNMNMCKNGFTLKIWFCLANYNTQTMRSANR